MIGSILFAKLLLVLAIASLVACGSSEDPQGTGVKERIPETEEVFIEGGGSYTNMHSAHLAKMQENKDFYLINVHIPYEGEIEGTDLFIPYNEIERYMDQLPRSKDAKIVIYCRSGSMSAAAAPTLVRLGYRNVWNLKEGMIDWERTGHELIHRTHEHGM